MTDFFAATIRKTRVSDFDSGDGMRFGGRSSPEAETMA
jgi:hypothetical protein